MTLCFHTFYTSYIYTANIYNYILYYTLNILVYLKIRIIIRIPNPNTLSPLTIIHFIQSHRIITHQYSQRGICNVYACKI